LIDWRAVKVMRTGVRTAAIVGALVLFPALRAGATDADDLCDLLDDPCVVNTPVTVTDGSIIDVGDRTLEIQAGGSLNVSSGSMTIRGQSVVVDAGGALLARNPSDTGGSILVMADTITMTGKIDASGDEAGVVDLEATGAVTVNSTSPNGIFVDAIPLDASGNEIDISGATVTIAAGAVVESLGKGDGCGGDITIQATADVTVAGTVDGSGGDGGSAAITAGVTKNMMANSGNINVMPTGRITATGNIAAACGGTIELDAHGDGMTTGRIIMDGQIDASAPVGNTLDGGGTGGTIDLSADGSIIDNSTMARYTAIGSGPDGEGGDVDLISNSGSVVLPARVSVGSAGIDSGGGCLDVSGFGDVTVSGTIDAVAGSNSSGEVDLNSTNGDVIVTSSASIDVSANTGGDAGVISIATQALEGPAAVRVQGRLRANGGAVSGAVAGAGGLIQLSGGDSLSVAATGVAEAMTRGPLLGTSDVGVIMASAARGPVSINGTLTAQGQGNGAPGGRIAVDAAALSGSGTLNASGQGAAGGTISVETAGRVSWNGSMLAMASGMFPGGMVEVVTDNGDFDLRGTIRTDGDSSASNPDVSILACQLVVESTGVISSTQAGGENLLTGREGTAIFGTLQAGASNVIRYNVDPPVIFAGAVVTPTPEEQQDASIPRCVVTPTPTPGMCVGDCNGDGMVTTDELVRGVYIALGILPIGDCPEFANGGDEVTVADLVMAVDGSLHGCQ